MPDYRSQLHDDLDSGGARDTAGPRPDLPRVQGPSEFTRVISAMPSTPSEGVSRAPPPRATPHPPPPGVGRASRLWPLIAGLALVVAIAVGLVIYFALSVGGGE